jgi:Transposase IS116/IS110/IS902 family
MFAGGFPEDDVNGDGKRLDAIAGVGPALATALVASVADPKDFRSGRNFSARIGLLPKQSSNDKLGSIGKQGDRYLCSPVYGRRTRRHSLRQDPSDQASALAHRVAGAASDQGRARILLANPEPSTHGPRHCKSMSALRSAIGGTAEELVALELIVGVGHARRIRPVCAATILTTSRLLSPSLGACSFSAECDGRA